jgi:hypothetical protein
MTARERFRDPFYWGPWIFLALALYLQIRAGLVVLHGDLAEQDPPAHFTTGVMLHDYLRAGHFSKPMPFAECFYVQYPKVAFGHWPPLFYVVEALWFFLFGVNIMAARWMCACIAGACALALYRRCRIDWDTWHAVAAAALFLALPIVRRQTWTVMSDLLVAVLAFLAICSLADYLASEKLSDALSLAAWTSAAILTKGTAWLLLGPMVAGPFFVGRKSVYSQWRYWLAILLTVLVSAPFYVLVSRLGLGYPLKTAGYIHRLAVIAHGMPVLAWAAAAVTVVAVGAAIYQWLPRRPLKPAHTLSVLLVLWVLTLAGFINLIPLTREFDRYYIAAVAPAAYLLAGVMVTLELKLDSKVFRYVELCAVLCCAGALALIPVPSSATMAFSQTMSLIPDRPSPTVILLEGDSVGEGAMIAARVEHDRARSTYFVRGSKFLSNSEWSGYRYTLNYQTQAELRGAIDAIKLDYIVLDRSAHETPDMRLLEAALADPGWKWDIVGRVPISFQSRRGELTIYHRESVGRAGNVPGSVPLGLELGAKRVACQAGQAIAVER